VRLSDSCYAVTGLGYAPPWMVNAGFVVGAKSTLVVDTGPTAFAAATIHGYASAVRSDNALLVLNTERHLDHIGGNCLFHDHGAEILGHPGIARTDQELAADLAEINALVPDRVRRERREAALPYEGTRLVNPTRAIECDCTLDLGKLSVEVVLTPGHTPTNVCLFVPTEGVLFGGDCIVGGYLPNLEAGGPKDWRTWLASLDRIESLAPRLVVPGHGPVLRDDYVSRAIDEVRRVLKEAIACGRAPTVPV
jgi:glyoxylase-like metal-dependent hydrolase (beta-lactamase superfamily II)